MDNIKHLIEVLKSQVSLYSDLLEIMSKEKEYVLTWSVNDTITITKQKEELLRKERIQEEARKSLMSKISSLTNIQNISLYKIIDYVNNEEQKEALKELSEELFLLVTKIHAENLSLRILYTNNNKVLNEYFNSMGIVRDSDGYGGITGGPAKKISTFENLA